MLQKSSTPIGQLATVHVRDWLSKDKQIYKLSSISFMGVMPPSYTLYSLMFADPTESAALCDPRWSDLYKVSHNGVLLDSLLSVLTDGRTFIHHNQDA